MADETFRPWGVVTDDFWQQPSAAPAVSAAGLPEEYLVQVESINDDLARGRASSAALTAQQLDAQATAAFGDAHPHTVTLRELRGDLADLAGDTATAAAWYLHTAGIRAAHWGVQHPLTRQAVERAHELWMRSSDRDAQNLYGDLLGLLTGIAGPDAPSTQEAIRRAQTFADPTRPIRLGSTG
jgi:hypothetical protein